VSVYRGFWRVVKAARPIAGPCLALLALCTVALMGGDSLAQGMSERDIRCLQLQEELAAAQGGGANREDVARIDQQIAQADRVFQGTQASMEDAGCFQSFFIFGRGLNRTPQCLKMNDRVEAARRQLSQLQEQRQAMSGGGGNRRRQAELQDAMARSGCGGQVRAPQKRGGGLFDFFGGGSEDEQQQEDLPQTPIYRSIDPNGRYRSVCVRLCDGFFYPISYSTYSSHLAQEAEQCQSSCAAPAELYVYRNPGQEIEQAISLSGSAYMDLPVALRFRKEYVQGCSCKQVEYNPTEIEAANKRAEAEAASQPVKGKGKGKVAAKPPAPATAPAAAPTVSPAGDQAAAPAAPTGDQQAPQLNLDLTGSTAPPSPAPEAELTVAPPAPTPPAPAAAAAAPAAPALPAPPPAASASAAPPASGQPATSQSTVAKKTAKPAPTPPPQ
jgi:uncharacterized protein DUF2865